MSAIWGHIDFNSSECQVKSMASEYNRKCKLDRICEKVVGNALFGGGLLFVNKEDLAEDIPYFIGNALIAADCILDNRDELKIELSSELSKSSKDSSMIPDGVLICLAYQKWGKDLVSHLKGIYSVAIFDTKKQELFLFTDRTSSRCLYYCKEDNSCSFSTLISPIKEIHKDLKRNQLYLKDFLLIPGLMPNISSTETPWENVFIIEAGCSITITKGSVKTDRYWSPQKINLPGNIEGLKDTFLETYKTAVGRTIRTDKGVAMALSGGFDSTSVAAFAAPLLKDQEKSLFSYTYVPHTDMSMYYPKSRITNESAQVKEMLRMYPNIDATFTDNDGKNFFGYVDELLDVLEIPFKAFVNLPQLLEIYRSASQRGCKVFLNGQTGNASVSFGKIEAAIYELISKKKYITAFKYLNNYCKKAKISRKKAFPSMLRYLESIDQNSLDVQENIPKELLNPFVNPDLLKDYSLKERNTSGMPISFRPSVQTSGGMQHEVYTLPALSYIGAMETKLGLYTGIVIRDATRDPDVLNYCYSFPFEYYSYNGIPRYLIRGFMKDMIPEKILYPILQTGVQSSDWLIRLHDSKDEILSTLKKEFDNDSLDEYINRTASKECINGIQDFEFNEENSYLNLFIIHLFASYLNL